MPLDRSTSFTYKRVDHYFNEEGQKIFLTREQVKENKWERKDADAHGLIKLWILSPFKLELEEKKNKKLTMRRLVKVWGILIHIHGGGFITLSSS